MGPNHIDARLGHQCHYGVLAPFGVPHSGGTPNPWGMGYGPLFPGIHGSQGIGVLGHQPQQPIWLLGLGNGTSQQYYGRSHSTTAMSQIRLSVIPFRLASDASVRTPQNRHCPSGGI